MPHSEPYSPMQNHSGSLFSILIQLCTGKLPPKGRTWCQKMVINWDLYSLSGDQTLTGEWRYCKCTYLHWIWPLARLNPTLPCAPQILWILHKPAHPGQSHSNNFIDLDELAIISLQQSTQSWCQFHPAPAREIQSKCIWACFIENNPFIYMMSNML